MLTSCAGLRCDASIRASCSFSKNVEWSSIRLSCSTSPCAARKSSHAACTGGCDRISASAERWVAIFL
eukprot:5685413-Prymnesium_polylepis.1